MEICVLKPLAHSYYHVNVSEVRGHLKVLLLAVPYRVSLSVFSKQVQMSLEQGVISG